MNKGKDVFSSIEHTLKSWWFINLQYLDMFTKNIDFSHKCSYEQMPWYNSSSSCISGSFSRKGGQKFNVQCKMGKYASWNIHSSYDHWCRPDKPNNNTFVERFAFKWCCMHAKKSVKRGHTNETYIKMTRHMMCSHRSASSKNKTNMPLVLLVLELSKISDAAL